MRDTVSASEILIVTRDTLSVLQLSLLLHLFLFTQTPRLIGCMTDEAGMHHRDRTADIHRHPAFTTLTLAALTGTDDTNDNNDLAGKPDLLFVVHTTLDSAAVRRRCTAGRRYITVSQSPRKFCITDFCYKIVT